MPEITIYGARDTMRALKSLDEVMYKEMDQKIKDIFEPLAADARNNVPGNVMRNWGHKNAGLWGSRLRYDPAAIRRGIKIKSSNKGPAKGRAVSASYLLVNSSAAGAIFELAGANRSNPPKNKRGSTAGSSQFIANAMRYGPPNRVIWKSWDKLKGDDQAKAAVRKAIKDSEAHIMRLLGEANDKAA